MNLFLNKLELEQLTGKKQKKQQIAALNAMGIPYVVNAAGRAVVTVAAVIETERRSVVRHHSVPAVWKSNKVKRN